MKVENTVAKGEITGRNVKAKIFTAGGWRQTGMWKTDKLPGEITGPGPLLVAILPLSTAHLYLVPDNSAACPSASPYSNSRVGQSTEPCNGEVFAVTWEER